MLNVMCPLTSFSPADASRSLLLGAVFDALVLQPVTMRKPRSAGYWTLVQRLVDFGCDGRIFLGLDSARARDTVTTDGPLTIWPSLP